jgi:hypothetical protein
MHLLAFLGFSLSPQGEPEGGSVMLAVLLILLSYLFSLFEIYVI